ncbi:hypothetical protein L207DRAFT_522293 [Hyaloscypha variabilis F]|uniref:Uncharacterized protein n=1 Tax=Hyaloscypha variabilis (strain UAMH 11265 / GT02V1 / F) TaxID=1149755 RepID=A0A2J6SDZ5_HYAVF|nr:hypothetical protein L207DRAFT_522293 [Hyaloscypha variabilis F]
MQYSLSTTVLFALALGTTSVHSSPLSVRDVGQTDETNTDIKTVTSISLTSTPLLKMSPISQLPTWPFKLNPDIPGFDAADQEFNYAFNSVLTAFQNLKNSGENGQSANQSDITECAMRSCG